MLKHTAEGIGFKKESEMIEIMAVTKALADENRVRLLAALVGGEMCVCQLIELIELAPSTVSKHLSTLRAARLIESRKQGRWMYYRLADAQAPVVATSAIAWLLEHIKGARRILDDQRRLQEILTTKPDSLCRSQKQTITHRKNIPDHQR